MLEIIVKYKEHQDWIITYTEKDIIGRLNVGTQSEADNSTLFYGPVGQYGSFTVIDQNNFVYNHIKNNTFSTNVSEYVVVEIYFNSNQLFKNKATLTYSLDNRQISFDIYDTIQNWFNIVYPGFTFIEIYSQSEKSPCAMPPHPLISGVMCVAMLTGVEIYEKLKDFTKEKEESFETLDTPTQNWLNTIKVYVPSMEECSLYDAWVKFCELSLTHLYRGPNGKLRLISYD